MTHDIVQRLRVHGNMGDKWSMELSHKAADRILVLESSVASRDAEIAELVAALEAAEEHLSYTGYGDSWERECARESKLAERIEAALAKVRKP